MSIICELAAYMAMSIMVFVCYSWPISSWHKKMMLGTTHDNGCLQRLSSLMNNAVGISPLNKQGYLGESPGTDYQYIMQSAPDGR